MTSDFPTGRHAALARLDAFLPRAGIAYARSRNFDRGDAGHANVSRLSPCLRHRVLSEAEVISAAIRMHGAEAAGKFVQEVMWRSWSKGWLELRPGVWTDCRAGVARGLDRVGAEAGLRMRWDDACAGRTGIGCFDHWARELAATGYLHNHARMWFASIWIFTLGLPWQLGADFFLRHLLDGDPASNTLGWRWVAGLQPNGRAYAATAENIARYTEGRFRPSGLNETPEPLREGPIPAPRALPEPGRLDPDLPAGWLLTEEDLSPAADLPAAPVPLAVLTAPQDRSPLCVAPQVTAFTAALAEDAIARLAPRCAGVTRLDAAEALAGWAEDQGLRQIATAWVPVGPMAGLLAAAHPRLAARGIRLVQLRRSWDSRCWPLAAHGFFRFARHIPALLADLPGSGGPGAGTAAPAGGTEERGSGKQHA
ncbi:FAD-binding domain-containing protein [Mangrovicoccus sp. HB161399]|uniref:FAD-binding domain-containing protein n=1 Tax=Mangrovicoccus sp. HB161399 TaxID=2720392 RepID=UPI0015538E9A|nr:FAD-binding domain-containing protein [Mangrovicoccus sp. HB161399]